MIDSIFERDKLGTSVAGIGAAIGVAEMAFGDQVPTGTYLDMVQNLPTIEPQQLHAPVMMITGEFERYLDDGRSARLLRQSREFG